MSKIYSAEFKEILVFSKADRGGGGWGGELAGGVELTGRNGCVKAYNRLDVRFFEYPPTLHIKVPLESKCYRR